MYCQGHLAIHHLGNLGNLVYKFCEARDLSGSRVSMDNTLSGRFVDKGFCAVEFFERRFLGFFIYRRAYRLDDIFHPCLCGSILLSSFQVLARAL